MLFRVVVAACLLTGCAELAPRTEIAAYRSAPRKRTLRVIGTEKDMQLGGEQYCRGGYTLEFTSWDKTEGLITCDR